MENLRNSIKVVSKGTTGTTGLKGTAGFNVRSISNICFNIKDVYVEVYGTINIVYYDEDVSYKEIIKNNVLKFLNILNMKGMIYESIIFFGDINIEDVHITQLPRFFIISRDEYGSTLGRIGQVKENDIQIEILENGLMYDEALDILKDICPNVTYAYEHDEDEVYDEDAIYDWDVGSGRIDKDGNIVGNMQKDIKGNFKGDIIGNMQGDIEGDLNGDIIGNMQGDVEGNLNGDILGNMQGDVEGNLNGDILGYMQGDIEGDLNGDILGCMDGDIYGNVQGKILGNMSGKIYGKVNS